MVASSSKRCARSGCALTAPFVSKPKAPRTAVSGVRSSWLTMDTNSSFILSTTRRSLTSRRTCTAPTTSPASTIGAVILSTQILAPSFRVKIWFSAI